MRRRLLFYAASLIAVATCAFSQQAKTSGQLKVLEGAELGKLLPQNFFYAGQTAPVQARNAAAARTPAGKYVLAGLVDSSGYSTALAEKYQGFVILEQAASIGGHRLSPGAYGIGSLADGSFVLSDLGGNTLVTTPLVNDSKMRRPRPLQISVAENKLRLYLGRKYVDLEFDAQ